MRHMSKKNMMKYHMSLHEYAAGHPPKGEHKEHEMHQGYNDRLDESLAMKHPRKHMQDMKARRDESRAMRHRDAAMDMHVKPY